MGTFGWPMNIPAGARSSNTACLTSVRILYVWNLVVMTITPHLKAKRETAVRIAVTKMCTRRRMNIYILLMRWTGVLRPQISRTNGLIRQFAAGVIPKAAVVVMTLMTVIVTRSAMENQNMTAAMMRNRGKTVSDQMGNN